MKKCLQWGAYWGWEKVVQPELLAWVEANYPGQSNKSIFFSVRLLQAMGPSKGVNIRFGPVDELFWYTGQSQKSVSNKVCDAV